MKCYINCKGKGFAGQIFVVEGIMIKVWIIE